MALLRYASLTESSCQTPVYLILASQQNQFHLVECLCIQNYYKFKEVLFTFDKNIGSL